MRRVDPDCVDEVFAQFHRDQTTSTISDRETAYPDETTEHDLLIGVEALIDFVQAAQKGSEPIEQPSIAKSVSKRYCAAVVRAASKIRGGLCQGACDSSKDPAASATRS